MTSTQSRHDSGSGRPETPINTQYQCNVCLDNAKDPVVSQCGHLFCWPCLFRWLETRPDRKECPVCKSKVTKETCTPIYGHGHDSSKDPRDKIPPRPPGRQERGNPDGSIFENFTNMFNMGPNVQVSFGLFPFGLLGGLGGLNLNFAGGNYNDGDPGVSRTPNYNPELARGREAEQQLIRNFFIWMAGLVILWIVLAD